MLCIDVEVSEVLFFFFFQAEDGIRDIGVTGVQTCALPIFIIRSSFFPDCLKVARVKPVFKKVDKFSKNNYRPISILSAMSKIVEKVFSLQI